MPIEINEIAIQLKVQDGASEQSESTPASSRVGAHDSEREAIVAECVSRVLRALMAQRER